MVNASSDRLPGVAETRQQKQVRVNTVQETQMGGRQARPPVTQTEMELLLRTCLVPSDCFAGTLVLEKLTDRNHLRGLHIDFEGIT